MIEASSTRHWPAESQTEALLPQKRCLKNGIFLYILVGVSSLGGFLFGYDTGVVSGALLLIRGTSAEGGLGGATELGHLEQETIVSSTIACCIVGSLLSGRLSQQCGRRPVLVLASLIFTAGALLMACAPDFAVLVAGRMVVGIAVGLASSVVPVYIAELAPPHMRGLLVGVNNLSCVLGQVGAGLVDGGFSGTYAGWRYMLGVGGVPSVVQLIGLIFLPESPRWLLTQGRGARARDVLLRLRRAPALDAAALEARVDEELQEVHASLEAEAEARRTAGRTPPPPKAAADDAGAPPPSADEAGAPRSPAQEGGPGGAGPGGAGAAVAAAADGAAGGDAWRRLQATLMELWAVRRQLRLGCGLMILQQLCGINTIMYYSSTILLQAHIGTREAAIWLAAPVACAQLVGCAIGLFFIDRCGRRPLLLLSLSGITLSLAFEGATFALSCACAGEAWHCRVPSEGEAAAANATATVAPPPPAAPPPPVEPFALQGLCGATGGLSLLGMVLYLLLFGLGTSAVPWTVNAEIYPMSVRSLCMGIGVACNWIANLLVAYTFLSLEDAISSAGTFWLYGGAAALGTAWLACSMPETANRSLEEVQRLFE